MYVRNPALTRCRAPSNSVYPRVVVQSVKISKFRIWHQYKYYSPLVLCPHTKSGELWRHSLYGDRVPHGTVQLATNPVGGFLRRNAGQSVDGPGISGLWEVMLRIFHRTFRQWRLSRIWLAQMRALTGQPLSSCVLRHIRGFRHCEISGSAHLTGTSVLETSDLKRQGQI